MTFNISDYLPLDEQQCSNCRYMNKRHWPQIGHISRECRRHAPRPSCDKDVPAHFTGSLSIWWPAVNKDDWCGEWSPRD